MKVRITDLLDTYYDNSVKLDPQPAVQGQNVEPFPRRRMQKPLLVAATLMLVITGAVALGFGFQQTANSGHALAEGEEALIQEESVVSAEPEVTPEPTMGTPEAAVAAESQEKERLPVELTGYTQRGNELQISLRVYNVPEGYTVGIQPESEYSNIVNDATVEDITGDVLGEGWETTGDRLIHVTVELTEEGGPLTFRMAFHDDEGNYVFTDVESVPVSPFDRYTSWCGAGIYEYSMEVPGETYASVTQLQVTQDQLQFTVQVPLDTSHSDLELRTDVSDWANTLVSITQSDMVHIFMKDGSIADITSADYQEELTEIGAGEAGTSTVVVTIDLANAIDPLEIDYEEYLSQTVEPEATTPAVIEARDADGDGVLTAALDLYTTAEVRQSPVCLTALTIDLETQQFAWHFTHPQLALGMAALSEENAADILKDEVYTEASNALVEEFFQTSYLVLTDGTKLRIASGNVVGYDEDFWVMDNLASALRDLNETVPEALSIDHLEINGVAYEFE